jgi:hypothetical protein
MANDEPTIHTGGGASVGKDAHAARDFVGRDQINFIVPLGSGEEFLRLLFKGRAETDANQSTQSEFQSFDWDKAEQAYLDKLILLYDRVRILGTAADVPLGNIFTQVYILDKPTAFQRYDIDELRRQGHDRSALQGQPGKRTAGIELVKTAQNLFILGKPGAGKTTFLKYIALQAARKHLPLIPIFVSLNEWADSPWGRGESASLLPFIIEQFAICGFPDATLFIDFLLTTGRALLLFDGLDEVKQEQAQRRRLTHLLQDFARKYDRCQHLITCRIAASDYSFAGFADVEVADFTPTQVEEYARHWFGADEKKFSAFSAELARPENRGLAELANTPLLLSLLCLTFDNAMRFPPNRAELYEDALDALLRKWDSSRQIQRDEIYRQLSPKRKLHLLINIAVPTFEVGEIFFRQRDLEERIVNYLARLPDAPHADTIDGTVILKAMEAQHSILVERAQGIYSFSHLTFQEYLTARYLVENQGRGVTDRLIATHLTDPRWREVLLLTASLLDDADGFVAALRTTTQELLAAAPRTVHLLEWANQRTTSILMLFERKYVTQTVYIFFGLARSRALALDSALAFGLDLAIERDRDLALARARALALALARALDSTGAVESAIDLDSALDSESANEIVCTLVRATTPAIGVDYELYYAWRYATLFTRWPFDLQSAMRGFSDLLAGIIDMANETELADEAGLAAVARRLRALPAPSSTASGQDWQQHADALFAILRDERDLARYWVFTKEDIDALSDYFYASELLVQCLKVAVVSDREAILQGLVLPPQG